MNWRGASSLALAGLLVLFSAPAKQVLANPAAPAARAAPSITAVQWPGWQGGSPEDAARRHCWWMRNRLREIRERMYYAPPWERERLEHRAFEVRERLRQECWGRWRDED